MGCTATLVIPKGLIFTIIKTILNDLKLMFIAILIHLGFVKQEQEQETNFFQESNDDVVMARTSSYVRALMEDIKKELRVIEHGEFVMKNGGDCYGEENEEVICYVCLSCVEEKHEIRELINCSHVFHKKCLDDWVDVCRVTCPLCRSLLFPPKSDRPAGKI